MTMATTDRPIRANMGRQEAEEITTAIRSNFDSLGKMLIQIRDRKGYLALGYQSLETYCLTEFGKGRSRVYQLIEEATIEQRIVDELAASDSPIKSLNMPGTYLRELKDLESPQQQIEAIAYANKLAENEGKTKATKIHLQVAVSKLSQQKPEQTKQIIKTIGFDKGVEVEILEGGAKGQRGVIKKIDKKGIHVELYTGNSIPILWDISDLKVVPASEKPHRPATLDTISIGDKVHIFSSNTNKGKTGEILARVNDKLALVKIEGYKAEIPYAELERTHAVENDQPPPNDSSWAGKWNTLSSWYYNAKEHQIHSFGCPDLILQVPKKCSNPSEWLENWRQKNLKSLIEAFFTPDDIPTSKLEADRDDLLIRLGEAQNKYISIRKLEVEPLEDRINNLESLLIATEKELKATKKELELTIDHSKQGFFQQEISKIALANETLQDRLAEAETIIETMVSAYADPAPEDTSAHSDFSITPDAIPTTCKIEIEKELSPEVSERLKQEWDKASNQLNLYEKKKQDVRGCQAAKMSRKEIELLNANIATQGAKLETLEKFARFRVGQTVCHKRNPLILGKIIKLEFSQGGMPLIWVKYFRDGELEKTQTSELVNMILSVEV
jgi:hypothetical protein